jgi:lipopolysaccharide biosynthesis glycosyltransferase
VIRELGVIEFSYINFNIRATLFDSCAKLVLQRRKVMNSNKVINVFFACDRNYIPHLTVAIKSIVLNASKDNTYNLYVLESNLDIEYKYQLEKHLTENFKLFFVDVAKEKDILDGKISLRDYYTCATYYRLFIPLLFEDMDKCLYLDSDIVVLDDIAKLYNFNLGDNLVGACMDEVLSLNPVFKEYADRFVGVHHMRYFNAGILLMNLKEFRKQNIFDKFIKLMRRKSFPVAQDQDYLNVLCKNQVRTLPLAWNKTPINQFYFNNKHVKIAHFKMSYKPWKYKGVLYEEHFWKYAKQTEYYRYFLNLLENFTEEDAELDRQAFNNLYNLVVSENKKVINKSKKEIIYYVNTKSGCC